jgi:hypothetical protein
VHAPNSRQRLNIPDYCHTKSRVIKTVEPKNRDKRKILIDVSSSLLLV